MRKYLNIGFTVLALCALALVFYSLYFKSSIKTGYINSAVIFNEFPLKKELEGKFIASQNQRKAVLDSITLNLQLLTNQLNANSNNQRLLQQYSVQRNFYLERKAEFDELNQQETDQYTQQVWAQINQYIKDYGKDNGYDYIYGADGSGSLMYASEGLDITDELKSYLKERYEGE